MMLTIEQMEARLSRSRQRMARLAAKAEQDYRRDLADLERARMIEKRRHAEQARAATKELVSFQKRLEATIVRLGANASHPAVAGRLHLIDLVRAGHKPGDGELNIPSDGTIATRSPSFRHDRSITGSTAALCAGV